jgi:hypothetical protein
MTIALIACAAVALLASPATAELESSPSPQASSVPTDTYVLGGIFGKRGRFGPSSALLFALESAEPGCLGRRHLEVTIHPGDGSPAYLMDRAVSSRLGFVYAFNYPDSKVHHMNSADIRLIPATRTIDGRGVTCEGSAWTLPNHEFPSAATRQTEAARRDRLSGLARPDGEALHQTLAIGPNRPRCQADRIGTLRRRVQGGRTFFIDRGYTGEHGGYGLLLPHPKRGARYVVDVPAKRPAGGGRICRAVHFSWVHY